jgi:two-component system sensor histidine kinase KdpD
MPGPELAQPGRQSARSWSIVALLLTGATAIAFLLDRHLSLTSQAMIYVLAVVLASYRLGWLESAVCAVAAVTALNFFFVPPRWTFEVESREHFIALATMLVLALVISRLATGLRRESALVRVSEGRARQLQALASQLADADSPQTVLDLGRAALDASAAGPCFLALSPDGRELDEVAALAPAIRDGMRACMAEAAVLGPGTGRWPGLNAWYLPLGDKSHMTGAACVQPALAGDESGREHAHALCALLAQALWRQRLNESMRSAQREAQRQQLQSSFLTAVSHDLRTPLAAILGAATSLQTQRDRLSAAEQDRLLASIASEASYLSTVTENTLQLVRLTSAAQELRRDWESMEEIVGAVLARVRRRDPTRRIKSVVPDHLPLVKADPVLLAQLIGNLLDNALKFSAGTIDLKVAVSGEQLMVFVKDRGADIPQAVLARMFEPFSRGDRSGPHGAGLGLALCRVIAQAHGGRLSYRRRGGGGSCFALALPLDAQQPGVTHHEP